MPSLGGVSMAKPPLEFLPLTPHLQKKHPHGQVQLLKLPLGPGETVLAYRRNNSNYLNTCQAGYILSPKILVTITPLYTHLAANLSGYQLITE